MVTSRLGPSARGLLVSFGVLLVGGTLYGFHVQYLAPLDSPVSLPFWGVALLAIACELWTIPVRYRRNNIRITIGDLITLAALFFAEPWAMVAGALLGTTLVEVFLAQGRLKELPRILINAGLAFVSACFALTFFHLLLGSADPVSARGWIAAFLTTIISETIGATIGVLYLTAVGSGRPGYWRMAVITGLVTTVFFVALALPLVSLIWVHPSAGWLLVAPVTVYFLAAVAYSRMWPRRDYQTILYDTIRQLQTNDVREVDDILATVVGVLREAFQGDRAQVLLLPTTPGAAATRTSVGPEDATETRVPFDAELAVRAWPEVLGDKHDPMYYRRSTVPPEYAARLGVEGMTEAILAPLVTRDGVRGLVLVSDPKGSTHFQSRELSLLEAVAGHVGVAVDNAEMLSELQYRALHDPLTNLPNRRLLLDHLSRIRSQRKSDNPAAGGTDSVGILFVDLDGFKAVNDDLGHRAGDQLLSAVAQRLRSVIRDGDVLSRFAGDEFVIVCERVDLETTLVFIAERVIEVLSEPFALLEGTATIGASIGVAYADSGTHSEELLRAADAAMYVAKRSGKGRYQLATAELSAGDLSSAEGTPAYRQDA